MPRRTPTAALLGAAVVLAITSCSSTVGDATAPPASVSVAPTPFPTPRPAEIPGAAPKPTVAPPAPTASPDQVAQDGLRLIYTWDTGHDTGAATATLRALPYLSPPMSIDVLAAPPVAQPGAEWNTWAAHAAVLTPAVTAAADDLPPDRRDQVSRQYNIIQTIRGVNGWTMPSRQLTAFVTLDRTPRGWRIASVNSS